VVTLLLSLPLGRLSDKVGAKPLWSVASLVEAALYFAWPLAGGMLSFIALLSLLAAISSAGNTGRNVYRIAVFPRDVRVRALAYMRSARNVGYTLGALAGGIALAIGTRTAIMAVPVLTGVLLLLNAAMVARLPTVERPASAHHDDTTQAAPAPPAWRNAGFVALSVCNGVLNSNQVLLNVVVPLWLVERTDAPHTLLAWLFGTNTVMAVCLQVRASRGSETVNGALRAVRLSGWAFVLSCLVISLTHETVGWVSIVLIWLGHVTITGAELWQSAADWGFQSELSDHRRLGDYQGVWGLGYQAQPIIFPGLFTFLALQWGAPGWAVIAAIGVLAAAVSHPAARAAERFLERTSSPYADAATP
jgi:MFS transporter